MAGGRESWVGDFFTGRIVEGISRVHANSHDIPWENPQKSIIIRTKQGGPGSVRFGYGLGMERFERFRFSAPAVPLRRGFFCVSVQFHREDGSGSVFFTSWKTVPAVPVPSWENGSDGSGFRFRVGSWATLTKGRNTRISGCLLVFPRNVIRIRMTSRNSLYNAPGKKKSPLGAPRNHLQNENLHLSPSLTTHTPLIKGVGSKNTAKQVVLDTPPP